MLRQPKVLEIAGGFSCDTGDAISCQRFMFINKYYMATAGGLILIRRQMCQKMGKLQPKKGNTLFFV